MCRLFGCTVTLVYEDAQREVRVSSLVADRAEYWWSPRQADEPSLWDSTVRLGEEFFNEIIAHPIPLDLNTLKSLKRSPLGLDLYFWLVYRTFSLTRPLRLSWRQLYRQFGSDPAKAGDKATLSNFRTDCLRELKKINRAWPDPATTRRLRGRCCSRHHRRASHRHHSDSSTTRSARREVVQ